MKNTAVLASFAMAFFGCGAPEPTDRFGLLGGVGNPDTIESSSSALTSTPDIDSWPASGCTIQPFGQGDFAAQKQSAAQEAVNKVRRKVGFSCLTNGVDVHIRDAATAHAWYNTHNRGTSCDVTPHKEKVGCSGFTGVSFTDRMTAQGSTTSPQFEVMAYDGSPGWMVGQWLASAFHALGVLDNRTDTVGFGDHAIIGAGSTPTKFCGTMDVGRHNTWPVQAWVDYPIHGQTNVPRSWDGLENPKPPAPPARPGAPSGWPSGPMLKHIEPGFFMTGISIIDAANNGIPFNWMGPGHVGSTPEFPLGDGEYFVYPHAPLAPNTWYQITIFGVKNGVNDYRNLQFTTGPN